MTGEDLSPSLASETECPRTARTKAAGTIYKKYNERITIIFFSMQWILYMTRTS